MKPEAERLKLRQVLTASTADRNVVIIPFCEEPACEERIKEITKVDEPQEGPEGQKLPSMGMKSLCIPFAQVRTRPLIFQCTED